jgi:hypothetical protein
MAKPTNDLGDEQLREGITTGEYKGRDALIADEILRRRHEERARAGRYRFGRLGAMVAAVWLWITVRMKARRNNLFKQ